MSYNHALYLRGRQPQEQAQARRRCGGRCADVAHGVGAGAVQDGLWYFGVMENMVRFTQQAGRQQCQVIGTIGQQWNLYQTIGHRIGSLCQP